MLVQALPPITSFADLHVLVPALTPPEQVATLLWLSEMQTRLLAQLSAHVDYLGVLAVVNQLFTTMAATELLTDPVAQAIAELPLTAPLDLLTPNAPVPLAVTEGLNYLQLGSPTDKLLALQRYASRSEGPLLAQPNPFPHYVGFGPELLTFLADETALVLASSLPPAVQAWLLTSRGLRDSLADRIDYLELQSYDLSVGVERVQLACAGALVNPITGDSNVPVAITAPRVLLYLGAGRGATWPSGKLLLTVVPDGAYRITLLVAQAEMLPRLRDLYITVGVGPSVPAELPTVPSAGGGAVGVAFADVVAAARHPEQPYYLAVAVQPLLAAAFPSLWAYLPLSYPQFLISTSELPAPPRRTVERADQLDVWCLSTTVLAPPGPPVPPPLPVTAFAAEWRAGSVPTWAELLVPLTVSLTIDATRPARLPYYLIDSATVQSFIDSGCMIPSGELVPYTDDPLALTLGQGSPGQWGGICQLATVAHDLYGLLPAAGPEPAIESFLFYGAPPWTRETLTRSGGMIRVPAAVGTLRLLLYQNRGDGYGLRFQGDTMTTFDLATTFVPFGPYPGYPLVCGGTFTAPAAAYLRYRMPIYAVSGVAADFLGAGYLVNIQVGAGVQTAELVPGTTPQLILTTTHGVFRFTLNKDLSEANPAKNMLLGMSRTAAAGRQAGFNLSLTTPTMDYDPCALAPNLPLRQYDVLIERLNSGGIPELFQITQPLIFDLSQLNVATYSAVAPHAVYSYPTYPWAHLAMIS